VHDIAIGAYGDPIRVASATAAYLDGGQHTTLVVTDVIAVPAVKAQATLPGEIDRVAFAPDGSLVVGLAGTGEVRRWTVSGSEIVPEALPLVAPTAGGTMVNAGFALTLDGRYLAVAAYDDSFSRLVDLVPLALNEPLRKLAPEDRLVGASRVAETTGRTPGCLAWGIAGALRYDEPTDPSAVALQQRIASSGVASTLEGLCAIRPEEPLGRAVLERYAALGEQGMWT